MKLLKKTNTLKNASGSLTLNLNNLESRSYQWYILSKKFNDLVILNNYNYSSTTCKHIYKVRRELSNRGINFIEIEAPKGLQNLDRSLQHYENMIDQVKTAMIKGRKSKQAGRLESIAAMQAKIALINQLKGI